MMCGERESRTIDLVFRNKGKAAYSDWGNVGVRLRVVKRSTKLRLLKSHICVKSRSLTKSLMNIIDVSKPLMVHCSRWCEQGAVAIKGRSLGVVIISRFQANCYQSCGQCAAYLTLLVTTSPPPDIIICFLTSFFEREFNVKFWYGSPHFNRIIRCHLNDIN